MSAPPFGEQVTWRQRVTTSPAVGNDTFTWSDTVIRFAKVFPGMGAKTLRGSVPEIVQGGDLAFWDLAIVLPTQYAVAPTDRFIARGQTYEVDGVPLVYVNSFTGTSLQEIHLRLVTG